MVPLQHLKITKKILSACKKAGYVAVCIGTIDEKLVPYSLGWGVGNIVAHGDFTQGTKCKIDGWPAIWHIVAKLGIGHSCGNSHQHCITISDPVGTFKLVKGRWWLINSKNISLEDAIQLAKIGVIPDII